MQSTDLIERYALKKTTSDKSHIISIEEKKSI